jgi:hypothetical protein
VPSTLALVSAAVDGDPHALGQSLAIAEHALGDALTDPDDDVCAAAADAMLCVLAAQSTLFGVVPPATAPWVWPLRALLDLLPVIAHGMDRLDTPPDRATDRHDAIEQVTQAYATLSRALR